MSKDKPYGMCKSTLPNRDYRYETPKKSDPKPFKSPLEEVAKPKPKGDKGK